MSLKKIVAYEGRRGGDFNPLLTPLPSCTNEVQNSQGQAALHASRSVKVTQPCPWSLGKEKIFWEEVSRSGPTGLTPWLCMALVRTWLWSMEATVWGQL